MLLNYEDWDELDEFRWKPKKGFQAGEWNLKERIKRAYPELCDDKDDEDRESSDDEETGDCDVEEFPDCR